MRQDGLEDKAMPSTTTPSVPKIIGGQTHRQFLVSQTEVGAATEASITVPVYGRIVGFKAKLGAGTATTIQPAIGNASGFAVESVEMVCQQQTAADWFDDQLEVRYYAPDGVLYLRSAPDAGADNAVASELLIVDGWE